MATLELVVLDQFRVKREREVHACGQVIRIRTGTTDLKVLRTSFGEEFAGLAETYPRNFAGLIVDAGGYIGSSAIQFALMYPNAEVVCIEASLENYRILAANTAAYPNIRACNAALTGPDGPDSIVVRNPGMGHWGFTTVEGAYGKSLTGGEEVPTVTLQHILDQSPNDHIAILKMDIEGAELDILSKPDAALSEADVLVIELHDRILAGCTAAFRQFSADRFVFHDNYEKYISVRR